MPEAAVGVRGERAALLVAPHGGRRPDGSELGPDGGRKVNDLHTAEITLELARRTGVSAIVNRAEDRNRLDWNRVSDVRAGAGWLLDLLLESARRQIAAAGRARIVFVHGWNAIQPSCDVGIGARVRQGVLVPVRQGVPSVPAEFLPQLARFVASGRSAGIDVTIGHRYPAAGRDNLLQIFTARYADDDDPRIRALAALGAAGRVAAVQLELAVPLRWKGHWRERTLDAIAELLGDGACDAALDLLEGGQHPSAHPDHLALEFHDGAAGIGGFAAIEQAANGHRQGRLLLCMGARRLGLFTGEDRGHVPTPLRCMGLGWQRDGDGAVRLAYEGPCLSFPRTDPFLDLERGLAEASLAELAADLCWEPYERGPAADAPALLGRVRGTVRFDGVTTPIDAPGGLRDAGAGAAGPWRERSAFTVPLGFDTALSIRTRSNGGERLSGVVVREGRSEPLLSGTIRARPGPDGFVPEAWRIEAVSRSGTWRVLGRVTHSIPVVRPAAEGRTLTVFGLARFAAGDRVGYGTFEQSQRLECKGSGS